MPTPGQVDLIAELTRLGWTPREIASAFRPGSPDQWRVVTLLRHRRWSNRAIADVLGVSESTLYRSLRNLTQYLETVHVA